MCEVCEKPMLKVRLEAVPWMRHCGECKEREQGRP
jgi:RNA polymerase-binding transcription factor DksA